MNAITVEDIRKTYHQGSAKQVHAVGGVSFEVSKGEIYGLLGSNGAGKSTLVNMLTTLTRPTSGLAQVCGFDVVRQALEVRRQIAVVLQQTAVETLLTVEDNLRIYAYLHGIDPSEVRKRIDAVLDEFELRDHARETAQDLSLGTKRRVQVAKVFMVDSPVIFLDESTTGMDPLMRRRVLDRIRREARNGRTILLTTQVLSEAEELCDRIMILRHGATLAAGSLNELRKLSTRMFRVSLTFAHKGDLRSGLQALQPIELRIEGEQAELLFKGEEGSLLDQLAGLSRQVPIRHFEVRGAGLEDIFVELVGKKKPGSESAAGS
ncbi:MAG: daunorubicin resistance transporter ATPase subunit [Nitrospira sp.]|nr:daunorubicin resistance transporter ATPase subunit [Nitrospira sp.]